jgi:addiction module HigA family antidote
MAKAQATSPGKTTLIPEAALKKQLDRYNLTISDLARGIKISPSAAGSLLNGKLKISLQTAQRLSKFFDKTPEYWISLQTACDLAESSDDSTNAAVLKSITAAVKIPPKAPAKKASATKKGTKKTSPKKAKSPAKAAVRKTTKKAGPGRPRTKKV